MYMKYSLVIALVLFISGQICAQSDIVGPVNEAVDGHQKRIDMYDGALDDTVRLISPLQTNQATELYFKTINRIQQNINNNLNYSNLDKKQRLHDLVRMLERIDRGNVYFYTGYQPYFQMIVRVQEVVEVNRITAIIKSDLLTALKVVPFFVDKPYAKDVLRLAARVYPSEVLKHYGQFAFQSYSDDILDQLCALAPAHVSFYMGGNNPVFVALQEAQGYKHIDHMMSLYRQVGSNSKAYILLDDVVNYRLSASEAHELGRQRTDLFKHLLQLRTKGNIIGGYSVDDELTYLATRKVREINELHEEQDEVRFALTDSSQMPADELYTLIVYGEDEVYTSSFLGLFKRLMTRITEESSYEFLHNMGRNKYRTFIKMCAAYNVLPEFVGRMSLWEKRSLFNAFVGGLGEEINPLEQAVAVADTYGSLRDSASRETFELAIKKEYQQVRWKNSEAQKLYGILLELLNIEDESSDLDDDLTELAVLPIEKLLKKDEHVQQHFFFDDEDGWASYATFIARFQRPGWKIMDKGHYVIIESEVGKRVKIYANKAREEYDGQDELQELFKKTQRFPDVVVHRGHSYYAQTTIETITPNSDLVLLGSCGGYNNIRQVLDYAPGAQIISSKQVGTMFVNNELIFEICENIRRGNNLDWQLIWSKVGKRLSANTTASERFADYLPPHKNLGAVLIRNYRRTL